MDLSDVRHAVAFSPLEIRHSIHASSSVVSIAREVRYCVVAIIIGFTTASVVKAFLDAKKPPKNA